MKTMALLLTATVSSFLTLHAADLPKPALTLTVKQQTVDTEHDMRGRQGSTRQKTIALRVEITNTGSTTVAESSLTGDALVSRAGDFKENIVKESLGELKVPAMKPNEKLTLQLGKIQLSEVDWNKRKFEEKLQEWQVTCSQGTTEIGKAVSSDRYATVLKDVAPAATKPKGPNPGAKRFMRP